jgi:hypothetical protein
VCITKCGIIGRVGRVGRVGRASPLCVALSWSVEIDLEPSNVRLLVLDGGLTGDAVVAFLTSSGSREQIKMAVFCGS